MNIKDLHQDTKAVSTAALFKSPEGSAVSMQILAGEQLKEHVSKVPALLLCLTGEVVFENEEGVKLPLTAGDYVNIEPQIKHWINARDKSSLLLIK
jgi:quercetin dioxygenase-like cupin family protein